MQTTIAPAELNPRQAALSQRLYTELRSRGEVRRQADLLPWFIDQLDEQLREVSRERTVSEAQQG